MASNNTWKLKRFARYTPAFSENTALPWTVYEAEEKSPIFATVLDSGYLVIMQGQESLDTVHLVSCGDNVQVHQKADNILFRLTIKGESRLTRLQFFGKNKEEAFKTCSSALKKLIEFLPVATLEDTPQPPHQTHTELHPQVTQPGSDYIGNEHDSVQGLLSIKKLAQHFLGDASLTLPQMYHHSHLAQGDFEPILRVFLLDPSFHAFVEKVEGELKKLQE